MATATFCSWALSCLSDPSSDSNLYMKIHMHSSTPLPPEFPFLLHSILLHCDLYGLGRNPNNVYCSVFTEQILCQFLSCSCHKRVESEAKIPTLISPDKVNQNSIATWHLAQQKQHAEQEMHNGSGTKMKRK